MNDPMTEGIESDGQTITGSFEQQLAELEQVVEHLESGDLELADSLERFKRGVELSKSCEQLLSEAQQVVDQFIDETEDPESAETSD